VLLDDEKHHETFSQSENEEEQNYKKVSDIKIYVIYGLL